MQTSLQKIGRAMRWAAACCALALAAACQTPPPAPAAQTGLSQQQVQVLRDQGFQESDAGWTLEMAGRILFETDSDVVAAPLREQVRRTGKALHGVGIDRLRVEGHTDQRGTRKYNEELSLRRARAVADLLVAAGILPGNVEVQGFGFDRPLVQNGSHADHQENRRVAIVVPAH